jgi:hypothetical protein
VRDEDYKSMEGLAKPELSEGFGADRREQSDLGEKCRIGDF